MEQVIVITERESESDYVDVKVELQKAVVAELNSNLGIKIIKSCNDPITNGYWFYVTIEKVQFIIYICKRNKYIDGDEYFYKARAYLVTDRPVTASDSCLDEDSRGKEVQDKFSVKLGKFRLQSNYINYINY